MLLKDRFLIYQVKRGKPEAFAKIYDKYLDKIYRFIFFRVSSQESAEDLSSQVFLKALEYLNSEKNIDNLQAFLYQIARNLIIDFYRRRGREVSLEERALKGAATGQISQNLVGQINQNSVAAGFSLRPESFSLRFESEVLEKIDTGLEIEKVEKALREIRDEYREVIILYYLEEMSAGEIARILGKSKGNVRVLVHRALRAVRERLEN